MTMLGELTENLMDVFLREADPASWTGSNTPASDLDPQTRGARNWDMKNANQAGALTARALDLRDRLIAGRSESPAGGADDAAEADIAKFEKQAKKALERMGVRGA